MPTSKENTWVNRKVAGKKQILAISATTPVTTYTTGSAPAVTGAQTIANSATPTVVELLKYCVELQAKINALEAAIKA